MENKRSNYRWTVPIFSTLFVFVAYLDRVNLSVATPAIMSEFGFSKMDMGLFQTVFFLSYALCQIPGGILAEIFGHRRLLSIALMCWSFFTILTTACSQLYSWLIVRTLFGVGEAPVFPGLNLAMSKWLHKSERGKGAASLHLGTCIGSIVGTGLTVAILMAWGWRAAFWVYGAIGIVVAIAYYCLVTTEPSEHPRVNAEELKYINEDKQVAEKKEMAPWKDFLFSIQFWALGLQFFFADYIFYVFMAWLPVYLIEARNFSLQQMGFAAVFPWIGMAIGVLGTGIVCDKMISKGLSKALTRSLSAAGGLVGCSVALYCAAYAQDKWVTVALLTAAFLFIGCTFDSAWAAVGDLAGKFTGSVSGWMNLWGNLGGAVAPLFTAWLATNYGWSVVVVVTALFSLVGAFFWIMVRPDIPLQRRQSKAIA